MQHSVIIVSIMNNTPRHISVIAKCLIMVLILYLFVLELQNYFTKPTHVSKYEIPMSSNHFPIITVCPYPSFNTTELQFHGYESSFKYALGKLSSNNATGQRPFDDRDVRFI